MIKDVIMRKSPRKGAHWIARMNYVEIMDIIMRKRHGGGKGQGGFQDKISAPDVSKEATPLRAILIRDHFPGS
jgi:hypothetical protein